MADNVTLPGTGGVIASDDVSGVQFQKIKIDVGGDGASVPLSDTDPLPVEIQNASLAVTGTFWQATQPVSGTVTINAIPAGTNNIGDVDVLSLPALPAGTNNIGDVDVLSLPALPAGTNNIGDVDVLTIPGIGGLAASGATASGNPVLTGGAFNTTQPTVTNGQAVTLQATNRGALIVAPGTDTFNVTVNAALPAGTNNIGDVDVLSLPALPAGTNNIGDVDVLTLPALVAGSALIGKVGIDQTTPGTTNLVALAANQSVNVAQINGVTTLMGNGASGTGAQRVTIANDSTGVLNVGGLGASAATAVGNPVRIGGIARTTNPTAATDGQAMNITTDKVGRPVVVSAVRDLVGTQTTTITSSTSETTIVTAVASTFCDLTQLVISNSSATATLITLKDATAGTTRAIYSIPAGGGAVIQFNPPRPQTTTNANWTVTCGTSVASIYIDAVFIKNI